MLTFIELYNKIINGELVIIPVLLYKPMDKQVLMTEVFIHLVKNYISLPGAGTINPNVGFVKEYLNWTYQVHFKRNISRGDYEFVVYIFEHYLYFNNINHYEDIIMYGRNQIGLKYFCVKNNKVILSQKTINKLHSFDIQF